MRFIILFLVILSSRVTFSADHLPTQTFLASKILSNISVAGTKRGVIIAAPSKENPNYYYHWTRDSALVGDVLVQLYDKSKGQEKKVLEGVIDDIIGFGRQNQLLRNPSGHLENHFQGYGEPRFNVDGSADNDKWCRPQNDGPALRVIMTARYFNALTRAGKTVKAQSLYHANARSSFLKSDLEFVSHHWPKVNCSLWEDAYGNFFYTSLNQRRALVLGADIAEKLGDTNAAKFYRAQALELEKRLNLHWYPQGGFIVNNVNPPGGLGDRKSNLDSSVILAINHAAGADSFFAHNDERVMATVLKVKSTFQSIYPVNRLQRDHRGRPMEVAIGRYPEDIYDGHTLTGGNPWFLLTYAFAEYHYNLARTLSDRKELEITAINIEFIRTILGNASQVRVGDRLSSQDSKFKILIKAIVETGDRFVLRGLYHAGEDGSMNEQLSRHNGYMRGVPDLTWGYASLLTATWARERIMSVGRR